jgi:hypothetical protein
VAGEDDAVLLWLGLPEAMAEGVVAGEWAMEAALDLDLCKAVRAVRFLAQVLDARK